MDVLFHLENSNISTAKNCVFYLLHKSNDSYASKSVEFEDVKKFAEHYKLDRFPNLKIGDDPSRLVVNFYKVEFTPFSALYNKKGKLIKAFKEAPQIDEILALIK